VAGARAAQGTVVVIDVIRAFSVAAYALAAGAAGCRLVGDIEEAGALAARLDNAVISAEVEGLPVAGIPISNSPTQVREMALTGAVLVQRTSSGTQGIVAATGADRLYAGSLVVASATARALMESAPEVVTLVAAGEDRGHPEDRACALYLEGLLYGRAPDPVRLNDLLRPLRTSRRFQDFAAGCWPGFPVTDLELCLDADRFDFAMPVTRDELGLLVSPQPPSTSL
jgi:2-phosphosulfolactate phosphatase